MTCARYRALISRYLDDELTARQRADLLDHLEHCASCAAELARYRQGDLLLRKLPEGEPDPQLKAEILRETRRPRARRGRRAVWLLTAGGRASPRVVAGALAVVVLLPVAAGLVFAGLTRPAAGAPFGFVPAPPTPTVPALDVPSSPTPEPPAPLAPPRVLTVSPYDGAESVDPRATLLLSFDQPMDRHSVEQALQITPPLPGTFQWEADNQVRFRPDSPGLLRGVQYTATLAEGAYSLAGGTLPGSKSWHFRTVAGPTLLAVAPASGASDVAPTATLVLTFSRPMDQQTVSTRLHLERPARDPTGDPGAGPAWQLTGQATWSADSRILYFAPAAPLPSGPVRAVLTTGIRDASGGALPAADWSFTVAPPANEVAFEGPRLQTMMPGGRGAELAYTAPVDPGDLRAGSIRFALYPLTEADLVSRLPWMQAGTGPDAPWPPLAPGSAPAIRTWTGRTDRASGQAAVTGPLTTTIPAREPGLYLLTADVAGGQGDQRLIALSDQGVLLWNSGGRWVTWVSRLADGGAVAGAHVRLYDAAGALLAAGTTDDHGLYGAALQPAQLPALAVAEHNGNVALAQLDDAAARQAVETGAGDLDATVVLDRAAYHPGDSLLFSAVVRPPVAPLADVAVGVHLRDAAHREIGTLTLQPDPRGAVNGAFTLAQGLQPGLYELVFTLPGYACTRPVPVAARPPANSPAALRLSIVPDRPIAYAGDTLTATLQAGDAAGHPAAGAVVTMTLQAATSGGGDDLRAAPPVTATLDSRGTARVPVAIPTWTIGGDNAIRPLVLTGHVADALGRTAGGVALIQAAAGRLTLTQTLATHAFAPGATTVLTLTVRNAAGRPVAGQVITGGLYTANPGGDTLPGEGSRLGELSTRTGTSGVATATLTLPLQGVFLVRSTITDTTGSAITASTPVWAWAPDSTVPWAIAMRDPGDVSLTADADAYVPGGTAHLFIATGAAGGGLLITRVEGRVVAAQPIHFGAGGAPVDVPIPAQLGAATAVDVTFARFVPNDGAPQLQQAAISLPIRAAASAQPALTLSGPPDVGGYTAGTTLTVGLAASPDLAASGAEALLALAPVTADAAPSTAPAPLAASWPGNAPVPDSAAVQTGRPVYWGADLVIDETGRLTTTVRLPDQPGLWSLDAWVFDPHGLEHQRRLIRVTASIDAALQLPSTLVEGDSTTAVAILTNSQALTTTVDVRLEVPSGAALELAAPAVQTLRLGPGEVRALAWPVHATASGTTQVRLEAGLNPPGVTLQREQRVDVTPYGTTATQTHAGTVGDAETITMSLPPELDAGSAVLEVRCAPTLAAVLADSLASLTPPTDAGERGPVETTAARLLASATVQALFAKQGQDADALPPGLAAAARLDLQYLYSAQHADGGWGAWADAPADLPTTLHVLEALWEVNHDGGTVDAATTGRGLVWLQRAATAPVAPGPRVDSTLTADEATRLAEAVYVRSLYGQEESAELDRLLAVEPALAPRDQALLALALAHAGRAGTVRLVLDRLGAAVDASTADPVVLDALATADPDGSHGPVADLVSALIAARVGAGWATPATTGAAILALSHYAAVAPDTPVTGSYRVVVDGQVVRDATVGPGSRTTRVDVFTVPGSRLHSGDNPVQLVASGMHLYYSLRVQARLARDDNPIPSTSAAGAPMGLLRVYEPGPNGSTTVVLTMTSATPVGPVHVDDVLPAGLIRLGGGTLTAAPGTPAPPAAAVEAVGPQTDGLHLWLGALPAGTYVITYPAAPVAPGSYNALPALLQEVADPNVWAQTGSDLVTVTH